MNAKQALNNIFRYRASESGGYLFVLCGAVTDFLPILSRKGTIISMEERSGERECNS